MQPNAFGYGKRRKLVPGRTSDPVNPDIEAEARRLFKDPRHRASSENVIAQLSGGHFGDVAHAAEMKLCGRRPAAVTVDKGQATGYLTARCRQRLCPFCNALTATEDRFKLLPVINDCWSPDKRLHLLSLALSASRPEDLRQLTRLLDQSLHCFTRSNAFRARVRGWARGIEIPSCPGGFCPVVRFIVEGEPWDVPALHRCWAESVARAAGPEVGVDAVNCGELNAAPHTVLHRVLAPAFGPDVLAEADLHTLRSLHLSLRWRRLIECSLQWRRDADEAHEEARRSAFLEDEAEGARRVGFYALMQQAHRPDTQAILRSLGDLLEPDDDFQEVVAIIRETVRKAGAA